MKVSSQREQEFTILCLFVLYRDLRVALYPTPLVWAGIFTQSTESSANFFQNTLKDTLRNNVLPSIWVSFSSVKLTDKINYDASLIRNNAIIKQQKFRFSLIPTSTINLF